MSVYVLNVSIHRWFKRVTFTCDSQTPKLAYSILIYCLFAFLSGGEVWCFLSPCCCFYFISSRSQQKTYVSSRKTCFKTSPFVLSLDVDSCCGSTRCPLAVKVLGNNRSLPLDIKQAQQGSTLAVWSGYFRVCSFPVDIIHQNYPSKQFVATIRWWTFLFKFI